MFRVLLAPHSHGSMVEQEMEAERAAKHQRENGQVQLLYEMYAEYFPIVDGSITGTCGRGFVRRATCNQIPCEHPSFPLRFSPGILIFLYSDPRYSLQPNLLTRSIASAMLCPTAASTCPGCPAGVCVCVCVCMSV